MTRDELLKVFREQLRDTARDAVHDGLAARRDELRELARETLVEFLASPEGRALLAEACTEEFAAHGRAALWQLLRRTNN